MKKLLILSLGFFLLALFSVSASGGDATVAAAEEPMEISWMGLYGKDIEDGNVIQKHLEEMFNIKLINKRIAYGDAEKINLMISSGEHPDMLYAFVDMVGFYMKGAFRSLPKDMIQQYAPGYSKMIDKNGSMGWYYGLVPGKDDEYIGLVQSKDYKKGTKYMPYLRLDWLEKAGIEIPGMVECGARFSKDRTYWTKEHMTFDEFENILYAFRDGDFDGNGKDDTIPFGSDNTTGSRGLYFLFVLHGLNNGVNNYNDNGKTVMMSTHSKLKDALKTGQKWFRDRLIDTELPNVDRQRREDKIISGISGGFISANGYIALGYSPAYDASIPMPLLKRDPDAKMVMVPNPLTVDGKRLGDSSIAALPLDLSLSCVRRDVDDVKLKKILEVYDYANFDPKGVVYANYGWPGEHFDWEGEAFNSYIRPREESVWGGWLGAGYYAANTRPDYLYQMQIAPQTFPIYEYFGWGEGAVMAVPQYRQDMFGETDYIELWSRYSAALNTIQDEFIWEAITTDMDIEGEWDKYVQKWLNAGGQAILTELEKMPQTLPLREGKRVY